MSIKVLQRKMRNRSPVSNETEQHSVGAKQKSVEPGVPLFLQRSPLSPAGRPREGQNTRIQRSADAGTTQPSTPSSNAGLLRNPATGRAKDESGELWLIRTRDKFGPDESLWPIHIRIERAMKPGGRGKGAVFEILRLQHGSWKADEYVLTAITLTKIFGWISDDLWLAFYLLSYGAEDRWPIHLRVEREMKPWGRGKGAVFEDLRTANRKEATNTKLTASIKEVFPARTQDRWLALVLQLSGPEVLWPYYLTWLWDDISEGRIPVPTMEVSGGEPVFQDIDVTDRMAYNCYEYAMGEAQRRRYPGISMPHLYRNMAGMRLLLARELGPRDDCDKACPLRPFRTAKIMAFVTDDPVAIGSDLIRAEVHPNRIIFWEWDFHFYRQDRGGVWSHKPGKTAARLEAPGSAWIIDPRTISRRSIGRSSIKFGTMEVSRFLGRDTYKGADYTQLVGCWCIKPGIPWSAMESESASGEPLDYTR